MKKCFVIISLASVNSVFSQSLHIDGLRDKISHNKKEDTTHVQILVQQANNYVYNMPDSAVFYADRALQLAEKMSYDYGEAQASSSLCTRNWVIINKRYNNI